MRMWVLVLVAAAASLGAPAAHAQATISPGMSPAEVRQSFGPPATVRESGEWTYWYYLNGCPIRCGTDDVVFFREGRVVAAVLQSPRRRFAGPQANRALDAVSAQPREHAPARVGGVRVNTPAEGYVESAPEKGITVRPVDEREGSSMVIVPPEERRDAGEAAEAGSAVIRGDPDRRPPAIRRITGDKDAPRDTTGRRPPRR